MMITGQQCPAHSKQMRCACALVETTDRNRRSVIVRNTQSGTLRGRDPRGGGRARRLLRNRWAPQGPNHGGYQGETGAA